MTVWEVLGTIAGSIGIIAAGSFIGIMIISMFDL
jgi:hypothetical protein